MQPLAGQPCGGVLAAVDLGLQFGERLGTRFAIGQRAADLLPGVAGGAMPLLKRLDDGVQLGKRRLASGQIGIFLLELFGDGGDRVAHRQRKLARFGIQPFAACAQRREHLGGILPARVSDANRLLDFVHALLNLGHQPRCFGDRLLERRQRAGRGAFLLAGRVARGDRRLEIAVRRPRILRDLIQLQRKRGHLSGDLLDLLREPAFVLARELQLLLEARYLRVRGVERALLCVHLVAGTIVVGAQRLQTRLRGAKLGLERFEAAAEIGDFSGVLFAQAHRVLLLGEPHHVLRLLEPRLQVAIFGGDLGLSIEFGELRGELGADVFHACQIFARVA